MCGETAKGECGVVNPLMSVCKRVGRKSGNLSHSE